METNILKLEDCIPVASILDNAIIARDGAVTIGWALFPPQEHTVTQEEYDSLTTLMASAFRGLPEWTMVHRQDIYRKCRYHSEQTGQFICDSYSMHFEGREYLDHIQYIWFSFNPAREGRAGVMKGTLQGSAAGIRYRTPDLKDLHERMLHFESRCSEFVSVITSDAYSARRLMDNDLESALEDHCLWYGSPVDHTDIIQKDGTYLDRDTRRMFSYSFCRTDDMPGEVSNTVKVRELSGTDSDILMSCASPIGSDLEEEHIVNIYYLFPNQAAVLRDLDKRRRSMTSMSKGSAENTVNAEGIAEFINLIHSESTMAVYTHMNVLVWGDRQRERAMRGQTGAALSQMGLTAKMNTVDMPQLWLASFPGGEMEIGEDNLMIAELEQALCLGINETFANGIADGAIRLCDRRRGVPVRFDVQETAYRLRLIESFNHVVVGPSGSGKSYYMNKYVASCYENGQQVFIIDKGDSYEVLCELIRERSGGRDGAYLQWSEEHPFSFNPLRGWRQWGELDSSGYPFFLGILQLLWTPPGGWDNAAKNTLERMVTQFLDSWKGMESDPVFGDFCDYVRTVIGPAIDPEAFGVSTSESFTVGGSRVRKEDFPVAEFSKAMSAYSREGRYAFLLNSPAPPDLFESRFTVFEMDALENRKDATLYNLCVLSIMNAFEEKMRNTPGFKLMVIEEAWKAIATESMADYIRGLWKTARKFHTSATVVTQQVSDIMSSEVIKDAIIGNSPVRSLLDQRGNAASLGDVCRLFELSPIERGLLKSVGRGVAGSNDARQVFVSLGGRKYSVFTVETSEVEGIIYESDKDRKRAIFRRRDRLGSMKEAVLSFVERARELGSAGRALDEANAKEV